jgi:formate dehydrogenase (NADP+) beta subunit
MRCEGENLAGVWGGSDFLRMRHLGISVDVGENVVVVGGGNTAIDAARTGIRLGANVTLLYRRGRSEMPASEIEVAAAEEEGVKFHFLTAPSRVVGNEKGRVKQLEYIRMELGEQDESGRRRPVAIKGTESRLDVDVVIAAIGQKVDPSFLEKIRYPKWKELRYTRWCTVQANPDTCQTDIPYLFTAGDFLTGPALVVDAIGGGRRAARAIHYYLTGQELTVPDNLQRGRIPGTEMRDLAGIERKARPCLPQLPAEERINNFDEVERTITEEEAVREAGRCLQCGLTCYWQDNAPRSDRDRKAA